MADVFGENYPDKLLDMCVSYCMNNLSVLTYTHSSDKNIDGYEFEDDEDHQLMIAYIHPDVRFPAAISDKLFSYAMNNVEMDWDQQLRMIAGVFRDPEVTPLTQVCIRHQLTLSDTGLNDLFKHPIIKLNLRCCSHCDILSDKIFPYIQRLRSLRVLTLHASSSCCNCEGNTDVINESNLTKKNVPLLKLPEIQKLSLSMFLSMKNVLKNIVQPFSGLRSLSLSGSVVCDRDVEYLKWIPKRLTSLDLSGVVFDDLNRSLQNITKASQLRHLDLSRTSEEPVHYSSPFESMSIVLKNLQNLVSLDISGTNLAGVKEREKISYRPGFTVEKSPRLIVSSFGGTRFEFLGLWNCPDLPFPWNEVPAKEWTCGENDERLLYSLSVYLENCFFLTKVLETIFLRLREEPKLSTQSHGVVQNLVRALQIHPTNKAILRSASACLFLTINRKSAELNQCTRTNIVETLISCLNYKRDEYISKCCLCSFLCLEMPHDANYCHKFKDYVHCLLNILNIYTEIDFFETYGLRLLHETCRGERSDKEIVGGATDTLEYLLSLIERKLHLSLCNDVMERAWSCLWSLTDDMPKNAERFMHTDNAMTLYMACIEEFPSEAGLLKKMTGLMANLSEVADLRKELMTKDMMSLYNSLLDSKLDGEGVSYHAASVISAMIADGPEAWTLSDPDRQDVLDNLVTAINSWDLDSKKKIKYRTLDPIIKLAEVFAAPEAQLWAVWALCNLVRTKEDRYGEMLKNEGGIPILIRIQSDPRSLPRTKELATMTLQLCEKYQKGNVLEV